MAGALYINNVEMPAPALEGLTVSHEKIWSANAGRTSSGKMQGTLIAVKTTLKIKWAALSPSQLATIQSAVDNTSNPFRTVKFTDPANPSGSLLEKTMYFGPLSFTVHSFADGIQKIINATVDAIER